MIKIKVVDQDNNVLQFKVKASKSLIKLKTTYAERMGVSMPTLRFLFDGIRIDDQTPKDLEMEDGDSIEVLVEQTGGVQH